MASAAAVPKFNQFNQLALSKNSRMRTMPVIEHPMKRRLDPSLLKVTGRASLDMGRPMTVASLPTIPVASSFDWSETDLSSKPRRKRRYRKKAMATGSKTDEEILEILTERLVDGFKGVKRMFHERDPEGNESVTPHELLQIMYTILGYISEERFDSMLRNLGLEKLQKISFDTFVSRFKEFKDIQRQWTPPLKRETQKERQGMSHPEENLRDCAPAEWSELSVAPQATYKLMKALREQKIDLRSILPDECYQPDGVVTKVQMRTALQEIGVNLTDLEYKRFWDRYDPQNNGSIPLKLLYELLHLTAQGDSVTNIIPRTPVMLKPNTGVPPRDPAKAAREFKLGRHKPRGDPWVLQRGLCVEGKGSPVSARAADSKTSGLGEDGDGEPRESPAAEKAARAKIRAAMNQKPQTKLDCIIDCLCQKFEEKYCGMNMAFKLFDIQDDGCVMRYDFRRVLAEFGFSIKALQLTPLVSKLGMSITHGLISYRQMLNKLMNRNDSYVSIILDEKIQAVADGTESVGPAGDTEEDSIARKMVEFLHQDYVKLAAALLRSDKGSKGVLPVEEVRGHVERCLGYAMTEKQFESFQAKLPYDAEGKVRYPDFMLSFNTAEPGTWNEFKVGGMKLPKNHVHNEPPEEVKRLERAKSEMPASMVRKPENRTVEQLRKDLEQFFTDHLHDMDRRFKELDRKSHKRFSKWQFGALLRLCGFPITEKELTDIWFTLKLSDDMMSTFNGVVLQFAPNFTPFRQNKQASQQDEPGEGEEDEYRVEEQGETGGTQDELFTEGVNEPRVLTPKTYLGQVMAKARPIVRANFETLRQAFRNADPHGFGSISFRRMQYELDRLKSDLTPEERDQICTQFDFKQIGRCNYLAFMKAFREEPPASSKFVYSPRTHKLEKKPKDAPREITINQALLRIRNTLIKHWKNLRRGFQKNDLSRTGQMTVVDFKRVLKECKVPVSEEDLYHILTEFDANMNGFISYPEFLNTLLSMDKL